jgi:hypothetical protein
MTRALVAGVTLLALGSVARPAGAQTGSLASGTSSSDTVLVAPPTGQKGADWASILAALARVSPGGTVQFAPGTYVVGKLIAVTTPGVTLLGDPHRHHTPRL